MRGSGRPGSNRRHSAWKADALPTELLPRMSGLVPVVIAIGWWRVVDLNHCRLTPADLQSAPFDRSGNPPKSFEKSFDQRLVLPASWRGDSNLQPPVYKTGALPLSYASKGSIPPPASRFTSTPASHRTDVCTGRRPGGRYFYARPPGLSRQKRSRKGPGVRVLQPTRPERLLRLKT